MCNNSSKDVLRCEGGEELERIATTSNWSAINQRFQEPAGQVLDRVRYSHIKVTTTEPVICKYKYK